MEIVKNAHIIENDTPTVKYPANFETIRTKLGPLDAEIYMDAG